MRRAIIGVLPVVLLLAPARPAPGIELLVNGGFESGDFTGWTISDRADGSGSFFIGDGSGATPLSGQGSAGPSSGAFYAVSDQLGPGTHALAQALTVPGRASSAVLSFAMFVNDWSGVGPWVDPSGLDHTAGPNQHARVDILSAGAAPFDTGASVVASLYLDVDPGPGPHGYTAYAFDLAPLFTDGGTFVLRFAEVDNQLWLNQGLDDLSLQFMPAPEPATLALVASGLAALWTLHLRRVPFWPARQRVCANSRRAPAAPGRSERRGVWAEERHGFAGALPSVGGPGVEERRGFAGALPSVRGVWGALEAPHVLRRGACRWRWTRRSG